MTEDDLFELIVEEAAGDPNQPRLADCAEVRIR